MTLLKLSFIQLLASHVTQNSLKEAFFTPPPLGRPAFWLKGLGLLEVKLVSLQRGDKL